MDIRFCDQCDASIPRADLEEGHAARLDGRLVCVRCLPRVKRARLLRWALIPLSLLAAAGVGAMVAVLILSPRVQSLQESTDSLRTHLLETEFEKASLASEFRGLEQVCREQMGSIGSLRRALEEGNRQSADLIARLAENASGNGRQIRAIKDLIAGRILAERAAGNGAAALPGGPVEVWLSLLDHEDPGVRLSALVALEGEKDERMPEAIREALGDDDPAVRAQAAAMAGRGRLEETLPALALLLEDEGARVRQAAAEAFKAISGEDFAYDATDPEEERAKVLVKMRAWLSQRE